MKEIVVIGLLGTTLDRGFSEKRWNKWRPSVGICLQKELKVKRYHLLYSRRYAKLAGTVMEDITTASPETRVVAEPIEFNDPWDFEEVYGGLYDFAHTFSFSPDQEEYLFHITTGTHVAQICFFLLTESRHFPGKLLQTSPGTEGNYKKEGTFAVIDLDLSKYDKIANRFQLEVNDDIAFLKSGIETKNPGFNTLISRIEKVAIHSTEPILLTGPTGAGKSQLAGRIYELKKMRSQVTGRFVEVNCATLRGEGAMSTLFGHKKGSFTGAVNDRPGLIKSADQGILFLDEVGELGLDEQAMLLRAVEEKRFMPVGADSESQSDFQLMCGTNRDLYLEVEKGSFREDLLARINLWTFTMPGLKERREDIEPNIEYELTRYEQNQGIHVTFNKEARETFLNFARSGEALWAANFRDLTSAVYRMCTLGEGGRITVENVKDEINRLKSSWCRFDKQKSSGLEPLPGLNSSFWEKIDLFDRFQLNEVVKICRESSSLSAAGRKLFSVSRLKKRVSNDADRLRKYLAKFGITSDTLFTD